MPTKKAPKKPATIEDLAAKSIADLSVDLVNTQNATREALTKVGEALIMKKEELDDILATIEMKGQELSDLVKVEDVADSLRALKEELDDAKREHTRALAQLQVEYADRKEAIERDMARESRKHEDQLDDEARKRRIRIEDEDRQRQIEFEATQKELRALDAEVGQKLQDATSFEDKVKAEVNKQVAAIKRELEFKAATERAQKDADIKILAAEVDSLQRDAQGLEARLAAAEKRAEEAQARAAAIATSALDKDAGSQALDELRQVAHKQAESKK